MKDKVSKNLKILESKTKKSEGPTCSICLKDDIPIDEIATLDGCTHQFCSDCIISWTKKCKNICPNCNATIKEISYKDSKGKDQVRKVEIHREEDSDEYGSEYDEPCEICDQIMTYAWMEANPRQYDFCERCADLG